MRVTVLRAFLSIFTLSLLAGCGSETTETGPGNTTTETGGDELLAPPGPGKGVQYKMSAKLEPGTEAEKCLFVRAPAEDMFVQRDEVRFTPGSHHVLLYETTYTDIPTQKEDGTKVDTSGVFDCSDGATNGWSIKKLVGGSQNAEGPSLLKFPEDVAMPVSGGAVLLVNVHYLNTSDKVLEPDVRVNLWTIPKEQVKFEGDLLFFYNPFIAVPAQGQATARMRCAIHKDITLSNFQSHMHARGVGYSAEVVGESPFYTNTEWQNVPVLDLEAGKKITNGSVIDYHCDFKNPGANETFQGPRSTDEMCMAIGSYYPADPTTSECAIAGEDAFDTRNLGAEWVGNGDKTCAQAMGCVQTAFSAKDVMHDITKCMLDSAPEKSKYVSDAIRCLFTHQDPLNECATEFSTCQQN